MESLYPLKFDAIFMDKIWGGQKIREVMGLNFPGMNCGEAWILSGVEGNQSVVKNGYLADNKLNELVEIYMEDLVGEKVFEKFGETFPILIKLIDANNYLSIQVHPDDELAQKRHRSNGKTEMWYIIDAEDDAELISGFKTKTNQKTLLYNVSNKSLKDILNVENVKKDDVFYMPAGRIHALGPGILLAEIQQTSDITYRVYDWDRIGIDGLPRETHAELALEALDFEVHDQYKTEYQKKKNGTSKLIESVHFNTNLIETSDIIKKDISTLDSFIVYLCLEGKCELACKNDITSMKKGEVILVPAIFNEIYIKSIEHSKLLEVYIA